MDSASGSDAGALGFSVQAESSIITTATAARLCLESTRPTRQEQYPNQAARIRASAHHKSPQGAPLVAVGINGADSARGRTRMSVTRAGQGEAEADEPRTSAFAAGAAFQQDRQLHLAIVDRPGQAVTFGFIGGTRERLPEPGDFTEQLHFGRGAARVLQNGVSHAEFGRGAEVLVEVQRLARVREVVELAAREAVLDALFGEAAERHELLSHCRAQMSAPGLTPPAPVLRCAFFPRLELLPPCDR